MNSNFPHSNMSINRPNINWSYPNGGSPHSDPSSTSSPYSMPPPPTYATNQPEAHSLGNQPRYYPLLRENSFDDSSVDSPRMGEHETSDQLESRRERNRIAARKSRQRKVHRVQRLEEEKLALERRHEELKQETMELQKVLQSTMLVGEPLLTNEQADNLHFKRTQIIMEVGNAINSGCLDSVVQYLHPEFILYGPQGSAQLKGKEALYCDYAITCALYNDIEFKFLNSECSSSPNGKHYRTNWRFTGTIKEAGISHAKEFTDLVRENIGKRISFEGMSNISFCQDKIIYMHHAVDQALYLSALIS